MDSLYPLTQISPPDPDLLAQDQPLGAVTMPWLDQNVPLRIRTASIELVRKLEGKLEKAYKAVV